MCRILEEDRFQHALQYQCKMGLVRPPPRARLQRLHRSSASSRPRGNGKVLRTARPPLAHSRLGLQESELSAHKLAATYICGQAHMWLSPNHADTIFSATKNGDAGAWSTSAQADSCRI